MKECEPRAQSHLEQILASLKDQVEVNPDLEFRQNTKVRLLNRLSNQSIGFKPVVFFGTKSLNYALYAMLIFLLVGIGTVFASQSALPSDILYPVKTASEQALLNILPSPYKGEFSLLIVDRRAQEIKKLNDSGKEELVPPAVTQYQKSVNKAKDIDHIPPSDLDQHLSNNKQVLNKVLQKAPAQAQTAIQNAIDDSSSSNSGQLNIKSVQVTPSLNFKK